MKSVMSWSFGECLLCDTRHAIDQSTCQWAVVYAIMMAPSVIRKKKGWYLTMTRPCSSWAKGDARVWSIETASMLNVSVTESLFLKFQKKFLQFHFLIYKVRFIRLTKHFQISSHPPHSSLSENVFPTAYMKEPLQLLGDRPTTVATSPWAKGDHLSQKERLGICLNQSDSPPQKYRVRI